MTQGTEWQDPQGEEMSPYSDGAVKRRAALEAKKDRGERLVDSDFDRLFEPNPDLPDCQSWEDSDGPQCQLPNHHEGRHKATVTWPRRADAEG